MAEKNTVGKYKKPISKRMLKEFDRKRPFSSAGPATKGPTGKTPIRRHSGYAFTEKALRPYTKQIGSNTFEVNPRKYDETGNLIKKDMGDDLPMSMEGSPTVTDTETGETTYGRPKDFNKGGMMECRGGGIAITGKKFQGVF